MIEVELERRHSPFFTDQTAYEIHPIMEALNLPPSNRLFPRHDLPKLAASFPGYRLDFVLREGVTEYARITRPARVPAKLSPKLRRALGWETSPSQ